MDVMKTTLSLHLRKPFCYPKLSDVLPLKKTVIAIASSSNLWKKGNYTHRKMENAERLSDVFPLFSLSCRAKNGSQCM